ncbi:lysylphosphatidylglycerol synthase transmembrane domain-containing protein [Truepera radiovictrix]|uniref:Flippase-like domain-containing protein n=1 Tax=Truepera radiovictrix (strain DSM 17093 / CIP 108686 / LMG 22925 / RQ-24) TaxID=649638 RepID=D7CXS9_TRURR|nr:flippase-like domain-containing protein [Truepera radiovictrix]ADI14681.1 conserved hypothetical protein [Truepera radiovictrix DSM 17093]WMT56769.1 flippase-like domain-containing protein [Truepera radiovictrix]
MKRPIKGAPLRRSAPGGYVWRAALASALFGLLGLAAALFWFGEPGDLRALGTLSPGALATSLALLGLSYLCGGLRVALLARVLGYRMRLRSAVRAHILGLFSAAVTPSGSGNAPAIALMLIRDGVTKPHAWSVAFYTGVVDVLLFVWALPLALVALTRSPYLPPGLLWWGLLFSPLLLGLWYALAFRLGSTLALLEKLFYLRPLRRYRGRMRRFLEGFGAAVMLLSRELSWNRLRFLVALQLLSAGMHGSVFAIFLVVASSLALHVDPAATLALFLVVSVASFLVPTPGGSGFLEFALLGLIAARSEAALVAPALLVWRALSFYLVFILGPLLGGAALLKPSSAPLTPQPTASDD